jgi:hypothetical protein
MRDVSRRALLCAVGAGGTASLAGCSALVGTDTPTPDRNPGARIDGIYADNADDDPHEVTVLITQSNHPVYLESKELPGDETEDHSNPESSVFFEGYPDEHGIYYVHVKLDDREWDSFATDMIIGNPDVVGVNIWIDYTFQEEDPPAWKVSVTQLDKDQRGFQKRE